MVNGLSLVQEVVPHGHWWLEAWTPRRPCSVVADFAGSGVSVQPDALLPHALQVLWCFPLQQITEVRVHL